VCARQRTQLTCARVSGLGPARRHGIRAWLGLNQRRAQCATTEVTHPVAAAPCQRSCRRLHRTGSQPGLVGASLVRAAVPARRRPAREATGSTLAR
jgi:hypothetical protein